MRRSKIILSNMIDKFLKMDNSYRNYHMLEVVYKNILIYSNKNNLFMFPEELELMEIHLNESRIDAFMNRRNIKKPNNYFNDEVDYNFWDYRDDENYENF